MGSFGHQQHRHRPMDATSKAAQGLPGGSGGLESTGGAALRGARTGAITIGSDALSQSPVQPRGSPFGNADSGCSPSSTGLDLWSPSPIKGDPRGNSPAP